MVIEIAIKILERHNEWRRGAEIEMTTPTDLGIAIDTILNYTKNVYNKDVQSRKCMACQTIQGAKEPRE